MFKLGKVGEKKAVKYLISKGYEIIEKNYRCKFGEIDIIARKDDVIVFVEVKTRKDNKFGYGFEAVDRKKINKIIKVAKRFLISRNIENPCRFDVISIDADTITHIENAFLV
ncbi:YraN family protein [Deferribacter abyssi]|uniref:YraN family protein n=1 Tax=Deferribacter abyssi TaxID=213806 RepID=UPI003C18419E